MRTLVLKREQFESVDHFKDDVLDIISILIESGAKVIRWGLGKNTAHIRVQN